MKKKTIINAVAILVALIVVVACSLTIQSNATVDCEACGGSGQVFALTCEACAEEADEAAEDAE